MILYLAYLLVFVGKAGKAVSNTTNLQEVLCLIPYRFIDDRPEEKKRAKQCMGRSRESETCKVSSVVCFKHFKPRSTPGFSGKGREFADSMA